MTARPGPFTGLLETRLQSCLSAGAAQAAAARSLVNEAEGRSVRVSKPGMNAGPEPLRGKARSGLGEAASIFHPLSRCTHGWQWPVCLRPGYARTCVGAYNDLASPRTTWVRGLFHAHQRRIEFGRRRPQKAQTNVEAFSVHDLRVAGPRF